MIRLRGGISAVIPLDLDGGMNTYAYVGGNPLMHIDPLGLVWTTMGMDYHGIKNWAKAIANRIATIGEGTIMSPDNCVGCTRDLIQEWIPHPDDPQNRRNYCAEGDPYPGQKRKIPQRFEKVYDKWNGKYINSWEPVFPRETWQDF